MTEDGNAVGNAFRTPFETLPHTTPHHTSIRTTSSRGMALGAIPKVRGEIDDVLALDRVVSSLRPDWKWNDICAAIGSDDRPWRTVVLASIRGAADPDIRHPNGLRYVNANGGDTTPVPPPPAHRRKVIECQHGAESGLCALCRNGVSA